MEERGISGFGHKPDLGKYVNKRKNKHNAYSSVYHDSPHFFDNCFKLVFTFVNTFKENSPWAKGW